jgi:hypothetical protein
MATIAAFARLAGRHVPGGRPRASRPRPGSGIPHRLSNVLNPKARPFFLTVMPQFVTVTLTSPAMRWPLPGPMGRDFRLRGRAMRLTGRPQGQGRRGPAEIYAHCIDGQADAENKRITDALGTQDTRPEYEPGDEGDNDIEQACCNCLTVRPRPSSGSTCSAIPSTGPSSSRSTRPDRAVAHLPPAQEQT